MVGLRKTTNGLAVAILDTPAGITTAGASSRVQLGVHLGRPVRATCRFGGRSHRRLQARGDIDLVPAGMPGTWEDDRSTRVLRLSISKSLLEYAAQELGVHADRVELVPQYQLRDAQLEHIAWAFEAELHTEDAGDWLFGDGLALALAARLVREYGAHRTPTMGHGLPRRRFSRVTEYIETHLAQSLSLLELAAVAELGVSHFKTLFKRTTGVPVHQYVMQRRVHRARSLLLEGRAPVDVALECGFSDHSHLARWMRRLLGVTPGELVRDRPNVLRRG